MEKHVRIETCAGKRYLATLPSRPAVRTHRDIVDLLAWGMENKIDLFLLAETDFVPEFYDLKTGLAGDVLQTVSNYSARLAIVGSFAKVTSKPFRELMAESNNGSQVRFAQSRDEAVSWLVQ